MVGIVSHSKNPVYYTLTVYKAEHNHAMFVFMSCWIRFPASFDAKAWTNATKRGERENKHTDQRLVR
jgi:hypothetical protein